MPTAVRLFVLAGLFTVLLSGISGTAAAAITQNDSSTPPVHDPNVSEWESEVIKSVACPLLQIFGVDGCAAPGAPAENSGRHSRGWS